MATTKYRSKYLPVEREIKIGDFVKASHNGFSGIVTDVKEGKTDKTIHFGSGLFTVSEFLKPHKLFLISDDIQVGDTMIDIIGRKWENVENCEIKAGKEQGGCYKVIGEILNPEGVEEGREFKRNDFECLWRLGLNMGASLNEVDDGSIDKKAEIVVKIK